MTQGGRCIRHWLIGLAGICSGLAFQQLGAQQTLPLSVTDAVMTHSFGDASRVAYSPDGAWVVRDGHHRDQRPIAEGFARCMRRLSSAL